MSFSNSNLGQADVKLAPQDWGGRRVELTFELDAMLAAPLRSSSAKNSACAVSRRCRLTFTSTSAVVGLAKLL